MTPFRIPLTRLRPSPYNPRKAFDQRELERLAASIRRIGVVQPIVIRPLPAQDNGDELYEIVAGERRWRASQLAGVPDIPFSLRELSLIEALEIQAIENLHRNDLHPLEEAQGYENLLYPPDDQPGLTLEQVAELVDLSPATIRTSLKLLQLIPTARAAFQSGQLTKGTALLIARMPHTVQPAALKKLLDAQANNKGAMLSERAASELLQAQFMLQLAKAPFDLRDALLRPEAGACTDCPKRTGAEPDLFADVPTADTCLDASCHADKVLLHLQASAQRAERRGITVLRDDQARALLKFGPQSDALNGDYVYLDRPAPELTATDKPLLKLLGADYTPPLMLLHPTQHTLRPLATVIAVKDALDALGLLPQPKAAEPSTGGSSAESGTDKPKPSKKAREAAQANIRATEVEAIYRRLLVAQLHAALDPSEGDGFTEAALHLLVADLAEAYATPKALALIAELWTWDARALAERGAEELLRVAASLSHANLQRLCMELLALADLEPRAASLKDAPRLLRLVQDPELRAINLKDIRQQAEAEWLRLNPAPGAPPAAKRPRKRADSPQADLAEAPDEPAAGVAEPDPQSSDSPPTPTVSPTAAAEPLCAREGSQAAPELADGQQAPGQPAAPADQQDTEQAPQGAQGLDDQAQASAGSAGGFWVGAWVKEKRGAQRISVVVALGDDSRGMSGSLWVCDAGHTPDASVNASDGHHWVHESEVMLLPDQPACPPQLSQPSQEEATA